MSTAHPKYKFRLNNPGWDEEMCFTLQTDISGDGNGTLNVLDIRLPSGSDLIDTPVTVYRDERGFLHCSIEFLGEWEQDMLLDSMMLLIREHRGSQPRLSGFNKVVDLADDMTEPREQSLS